MLCFDRSWARWEHIDNRPSYGGGGVATYSKSSSKDSYLGPAVSKVSFEALPLGFADPDAVSGGQLQPVFIHLVRRRRNILCSLGKVAPVAAGGEKEVVGKTVQNVKFQFVRQFAPYG